MSVIDQSFELDVSALPPETRRFQQAVREFAREEVAPRAQSLTGKRTITSRGIW